LAQRANGGIKTNIEMLGKPMEKPVIAIYDTVGTGIIIAFPTGIMVTNQTGGTACLHPKIEGIYLPLANDCNEKSYEFIRPEIALNNYFNDDKYQGTGATKGIDRTDAKAVNTILEKVGLSSSIEVDMQKLAQSHEAWIRITIKNNISGLLDGFKSYPLQGVLTWNNND
jgi:hypothetical protein